MPWIVNSPLTTRGAALAVTLAALLSACATSGPASAPAPAASSPVAPGPAPTPQMLAEQEALSKMVALQDRLYKVAAPLLINNAELCKTQARNLLGFTAKNRFSFSDAYAEAAQHALGYGERLQVSGVLTGSGAARAGLRKGDVLIDADGKLLPTGPRAETEAAAIFGQAIGSRAILNMTIARGNGHQVLNVPVTRACAFRVELGNADSINSYADGQRVMLTRGLINFAQTDQALAYVMAKGMAHNILGHAAAQHTSATIASIIDNLLSVQPDLSLLIGSGGMKAMPQELDAAADTLALYLLARAGYNINETAAFWQRLAKQYPATVLNGYTANHPGTAYRIAAINKTVGEIKARQAARTPLLP